MKRLYAITFGIGAACVGAAGALMLLLVDVQPYLADRLHAPRLHHRDPWRPRQHAGRAARAACWSGVSEALAGFFIAPSLKSMFSFGLLILVLLVRPQGLLGRRA